MDKLNALYLYAGLASGSILIGAKERADAFAQEARILLKDLYDVTHPLVAGNGEYRIG